MIYLLFGLPVAVSVILAILGRYGAPISIHYVFKPFTMVLIIAMCGTAINASGFTTYRALLLAALLFSITGDILLMLPSDRFLAGLISFLIAHLFYTAAFVSETGLGFTPQVMIPNIIIWIAMYFLLIPGAGKDMALPVIVYMTVILIMVWQAWERYVATGSGSALLAAAGATLFLISDALIGFNRFRTPFGSAEALILSTYFTSQFLLVASAF